MPRSEEVAKGRSNARSKGGKPKKQPTQGEFHFLNVNITEDMKKRVNAYWGSGNDVWEHVEQLVGGGYRVGLSFTGDTDTYTASVTNRDGPVEHRGGCLTARGGTAFAALARVVGLHYAVANEDWAEFGSQAQDYDTW